MSIKKYLRESAKYLLRSPFVIRKHIRKVESLYKLSPEELRDYEEKQFLKLVHYAYEHSPFYRKLYDQVGVDISGITSLDDIQKLPIITKEMVRKHSEEFLTVPLRKVMKGHTSGSTGTPLHFYYDWDTVHCSRAYDYVVRFGLGFKMGEKLVSLRGNLDKNDFRLKVHAANTLYLSSYNINAQNIEKYYEAIKNFKPKAIEGYPSSLYSLALFMKAKNLELNVGIIFTSSETLFDYQRNLIERQFNGEIYDHYGMSERVIYLTETKDHSGYLLAPGYSIAEVVPDGEICTSLINFAFPLIRYKSTDILEVDSNEKRQLLVKQIVGRVDDYIIAKDGSHLTRIDFIEDGKNIIACQWVQSKAGELEVRIVPDEDFKDEDLEFVRKQTLNKIGADNIDLTVKLCKMEDMILTARGKFKLIVNLIK